MAIKRINITRLKKRLKENLELEIAIMKRMHHPNIVALYDTLVRIFCLFASPSCSCIVSLPFSNRIDEWSMAARRYLVYLSHAAFDWDFASSLSCCTSFSLTRWTK